ncbi:MAG TPA: NAD(P)/FAD-dependent oxidoreductase [Candidatus Binataceae bacterium]|jgi:4-hydroxyacetophenone monooxygenase|nr:NAD(P)/FAD-dependent oxidoreductase [Candidatus Binataceae bacterium]
MTERSELLTATDETIDDAVRHADPMVLRGLLYQLTGDESIAATESATVVIRNVELNVVKKTSDVALIQSKAAAFLKAYRDQGASDISYGPPERLHRSLSLAAGVDIRASEFDLWLEQLALDPWVRKLDWPQPPSEQDLRNFKVAVIGAGMGGLNAAVQLKHAGIPYFVIEKNEDVGGTWFENRYPGARVDTPSRTYTHTYGVNFEYPNPYCPQRENLKYFRWVADHFDVRKDIMFNTEVKSVIWDEETKLWEIKAEGPQAPQTWRVNAVIASVGFLSRPNLPEVPGMETFKGQSFHTARWPQELELKGKRVAVIGTGATGYQMTPELAKMVGHTYVFQRTPSWCFENKRYLEPFPPQVNWLDRNFPYLTNFIRFRVSHITGPEFAMKTVRIDPEFKDEHARSALNKNMRESQLAFLRSKLASRPDLIEKMTPVAPPYSSRPVIVDARYCIYDALLRDDVTLVTEPIRKITRSGIEVEGGVEYALDIIVYATGFKANDFLWPMEVRGRGGQRIEELWAKDGARAYLGTMLPGFPNFFMLYGPNTNNSGGLQIVDFEEMVTRFALQCFSRLITGKKSTIDVLLDAYWRYNEELDRYESLMIYKDPRAKNYYKNESGRSATNCPIDVRKIWTWLRNPAAGHLEGRPGDAEALANPLVRPYFGEDLVVE